MRIRNNFASKKQFLISQLALLTGLLLTIPARLYPQFHPDIIDFARAFLITIAIGMLGTAALKNRRR